ncbi:MAG: ferritin [Planctomycetes bacterium]|nr:ferritin [Planctomycetota bacterium]
MMISSAMNAKLNEQIQGEFSAAHGYLAMACAFDAMGLKILARKFLGQHEEEREHGMKILHYLQEVGGTVTLSAIDEPRTDYTTAESIVTAALDSELHVTKMINEVMALAESEKDYATRSFLQWFVDEQVEEVSQMTDLLNLVKMAGGNLLQVEARVRHEMMSNK